VPSVSEDGGRRVVVGEPARRARNHPPYGLAAVAGFSSDLSLTQRPHIDTLYQRYRSACHGMVKIAE
jgi:hypothetical protein